MNSAEPSETSRCVRRPASRSRSSRSRPIAPPSAAATSEPDDARQSSVGTRAQRTARPPAPRAISLDPPAARSSSSSSSSRVNGAPLRGRLHLDEPAVAGHDDVHVDLGGRVLGVVEVEQRLAVDDPDRDGGDRPGERLREAEPVERAAGGDVRAGDRRAARAAVGLQDVAVEPDRPLAERLEVDHARGARGRSAAGSPPCGRPACRATPRASMRSPVDAGSSEYSAVIQPLPVLRSQRGTLVVDRSPCRAPSSCPATTARSRAAARGSRARSSSGRSSSVRRPLPHAPPPPARAARRARPRRSAAAGSARPISRNTSGSPVVMKR